MLMTSPASVVVSKINSLRGSSAAGLTTAPTSSILSRAADRDSGINYARAGKVVFVPASSLTVDQLLHYSEF